MLQFVKSAKQLYLSIKQLQFNKEIMRQSYEIKRKAVIFFREREQTELNKELKVIDFYCKKCKKSMKVSYMVTGNRNYPVLQNKKSA